MARPRLIYASATSGVHDQRWIDALESLGFAVDARMVASGQGPLTVDDSDEILAIVAGPLTTITRHLLPTDVPVIGLSWGFDLQQGEDLTWLPALDGLIVDTEHTRSIAIQAGVEASRVVVVPWGIDLDRIAGITAAEVPAAPSGVPVVLSARAHESIYRIEDILRGFAAAAVPGARLIVAHGGSRTASLRQLAADLGIDAVFTGTLDEDALVSLIKRADVYVTASEVDGTSVTMLQAMASGARVVASDTPGNREWIMPGRTGWIFTTGDVAGLAAALTAALADDTATVREAAQAEVAVRADWKANVARLSRMLPISLD